MTSARRTLNRLIAGGLAAGLLLAGCSDSDSDTAATSSRDLTENPSTGPAPSDVGTESDEAPTADEAPMAGEAPTAEDPAAAAPPAAGSSSPAASPAPPASARTSGAPKTGSASKTPAQSPAPTPSQAAAPNPSPSGDSPAPTPEAPAAPAPDGGNGGATDVGVTADQIKLGGIFMYGYALGNLAIQPMHREMQGIAKAVNDSGGIHGRRIKYVDCDDGPPDPARTRACYKKLVEQEKIFAMMGGCSFNEAQYQKDLERDKVPAAAPCSLFREEWQNPYAFPIHMDMSQEALANADWVMKAHKPKKYGIICLNNPEMRNACELAEASMAKAGAELVFKRIYQAGTPDMSGDIIAARTAAPEHILHYTVDPTVTVRFFVDAQQQGYWPPKGMSGNHMALEVIGPLMGDYPAKGGYWTNTTYKIWGSDYMAWQRKYVPNNKGLAHHVTQGQWFGANAFMEAIRKVGPNLTREGVKEVLYSQAWETGPTLGQKFLWDPAQRYSEGYGNAKEYMYKYVGTETQASDQGNAEPLGFVPAEPFEMFAPAINPHTGTGK